jgi:hypothetical protein
MYICIYIYIYVYIIYYYITYVYVIYMDIYSAEAAEWVDLTDRLSWLRLLDLDSRQPSSLTYIYTYVLHTHIHTYYIHTYTHTYIHTYMHTYIHAYIHTYIHTYICMYVCIYICICRSLHSFLFWARSRSVYNICLDQISSWGAREHINGKVTLD